MWRGIQINNAVYMCRCLVTLLIRLCPANEISQELKDDDYEEYECISEWGIVDVEEDDDNLEAKPWFHRNITRAEAELLLGSGINGSFLVRESESKPGHFSISLRYDGRTLHYCIHTDAERKLFYVDPGSTFETISELVAHYSKEPDGFPTTLTPHAPDQWDMSRSDIEIGKKLHEGQYSVVYKASLKRNQFSLAVKTLKVYTNTVYILRGWGNCVTHSCAYGFAYYYVFGKVCTAY